MKSFPVLLKNPWVSGGILAIILVAGLAMRLPFLRHAGLDDMFFTAWADGLLRYGMTDAYRTIPTLNYPPLYIYILDGIAHLFRAYSEAPTSDQSFVALQKSFNVLIDLINALLLFTLVRRISNQRQALWITALWFLSPYPLYDSAIWGQVDTLITLFLLLSLYGLQTENLVLTYLALALGLLTKAQMAVALPLILLFAIRRFGWKAQLLPLLISLGVSTVILWPFIASGTLSLVISAAYLKASSYFPYMSLNAHNIWWLFSDPNDIFARSDAIPVIGSLTAKTVGVLLFVAAYAIAFVTLLRKPLTKLILGDLAFGSAFAYFAFYILNTEMHERYLYPFFALWLLSNAEPLIYYGMYLILTITQTLSLAFIIPFIPQAFWLRTNYFPSLTYPLTYINLYCFILTGGLYVPVSGNQPKPKHSNPRLA